MATYGRESQKKIALKHLEPRDYRQLGSMMVCLKPDYENLKQEFEKLLKLDVNCKFLEKNEVE